jgi:hypothetical protein
MSNSAHNSGWGFALYTTQRLPEVPWTNVEPASKAYWTLFAHYLSDINRKRRNKCSPAFGLVQKRLGDLWSHLIKKEALGNFKWLSQECHCDDCLSTDTTFSSACKFSGVFISSYSILNTIVCFVLFPPLLWKNYLSFSVFLCAAGQAYWWERGEGGAKSYDREKARPSINHSIFSRAQERTY